jgi:hypothetical protein
MRSFKKVTLASHHVGRQVQGGHVRAQLSQMIACLRRRVAQRRVTGEQLACASPCIAPK